MAQHLPQVRALGQRYLAAVEEASTAERELALALQAAHADGVPVLRLARESGLSRKRTERLLVLDVPRVAEP